jgi:hypothetical protein
MNRVAIATLLAVSAAVMLPVAVGQEKPKTKTEEQSQTPDRVEKRTPLKLQIVFAEFDGERKVKSLPYTLLTSPLSGRREVPVRLRIGSRVPVYTGKDGGMTYVDVGTNIDCSTSGPTEDGQFYVQLLLEQSWVEGDVPVAVERPGMEQAEKLPPPFRQPVIRQFKSDLNLIMRDAQTVESTLATDPLSGKVIKVAVTLNVVK